MDLGLAGKRALVIGASQGIGAETVRILAAEGCRLALAGRNRDGLAEVARTCADAIVVPTDLTIAGDAEQAVAATVEAFGGLDILVVSAGAAQGGDFWTLDDRVFAEAFELKFMGMVRALRAALVPMRAARTGRIVVIVGNNGRQPMAKLLPGSAANAACLAVIKGVADAVLADGISVNALNPGPTRTGRWTTMIANLSRQSGRDPDEVEAGLLANQPGGRIGDPQAMARLAAILVSDLADMVTGTSLTADGGATRAIA